MKITVTHICGHEEEIVVYGPGKQREWRIKNEEKSYCPVCKMKRFESIVIERLQVITDIDTLPPLEGTEKQVDWANKLRLRTISGMLDALEAKDMVTMMQTKAFESIAGPLKALIHKIKPEIRKAAMTPEGSYSAMIDALKKAICAGVNNNSAKYWIDNREENYALAGYLLANISNASVEDTAEYTKR